MTREIGTVRALYRYPVKSMAAEPLESIECGWYGFAGDRRYAFIRDGMTRSGFPWLTIRENPDMWRYTPRFAEPSDPEKSPTIVRTPEGDELDVVDPALCERLGHGARVLKQNRGIFDALSLSLITTQTIAALSSDTGIELDPRRFRPNIIVESIEGGDSPEIAWVGETLTIGEMQMRIDKRDKRCVLVNVDPVTTQKDASILREIAQTRQACLGVYGSTVTPGRVRVGDPVVIE